MLLILKKIFRHICYTVWQKIKIFYVWYHILYGLSLFAVGFRVLRVADIDKRAENISKTSQMVVDDFAAYTSVNLSSRPKYISVNSDNTTVSVCFKEDQINVIHLYDIQSFRALVLQPLLHFGLFLFLFQLYCCIVVISCHEMTTAKIIWQ